MENTLDGAVDQGHRQVKINQDIFNLVDRSINPQIVISIDELETMPSSTLYREFVSKKKSQYRDKDRFILTNFHPVKNETLVHIKNTLDYLDIPHFFVLVITNQTATSEFFNSWIDDPVTLVWTDCGDIKPKNHGHVPAFNVNGFMCPHAWVGLHVNPDGTTRLCCEYNGTIKNHHNKNFNIHTDDFDQIVNSQYMINIRNEFRSGQMPAGCHKCTKAEASSGVSKRTLTPFKLDNTYGLVDWESDHVTKTFLGGHLGNLCNLKCRICSEKYSSSIASEKLTHTQFDRDHESVKNVMKINYWGKDHKNFWELVKANPSFINFEILGGEPLLIKQNLDVIDYLIDNNLSQNCNFEFVTNGTHDLDFLLKTQNFRKFHITFSIDNVDQRFELERSGAAWSNVSDNLLKYLNWSKQHNNLVLGVSVTVNIQNVLYLPETINRLRSLGLSSNHYYFNVLTHPEFLSINNVTLQARSLILEKLSSSTVAPEDYQKMKHIINKVKFANTSDGAEFCAYMKHLDSIRGENFSDTHPEISHAMGYNR